MQHPDTLYQAKASLPFSPGRARETCKQQQQSRDKSCLLAFRPGRNSKEEVPADLNSFQLRARWCCTEAAGSRDDGLCKLNKKLLPRHTILDIQTKLPPPTGCPREFFWSFFFLEKTKKKSKEPFGAGTVSLRRTVAQHR